MEENRKLLFGQLRENAGYVAAMTALSVVISVLGLTIPWFMKFFTDNVVVAQDFEKVRGICIAFGVLIAVRYLVDMAYEKLLAYVTYNRIVLKLRKQVEQVLIYLDTKYLYKAQDMIPEKDIESVLLGDVDAFKNILAQTVKFFTEILKLAVYIGVLFYYSVPAGIIVCIRIPVYYLLAYLFDKPLDAKNEEKRALMSGLIQTVKQIFASLPAIKTLQAEGRVRADLDGKIEKYCDNQKVLSVVSAKYQELNTAVNTIVNLCILIICGYAVLSGHMTIGTMMLVSNVQSRTTMPLFFFNNYYLQYKSCFPGISRLVRFLGISTEKETAIIEKRVFDSIELKDICYAYDDRQTALQNFSLRIKAGEKIVLTGDNMTGKSTLLKILAGLIRADSGSILVDGNPVGAMELRNYATLFLQDQECYRYFGNSGSGGEVQLENLSLVKDRDRALILLDEADANVNEKRLEQVYDLLASAGAVILVTHRGVGKILADHPAVKVVDMGECSAASILS
ncbi:MAG: ABC transporter ATP-binding protein [Lachnospiraceae bacterium]|jgi:ABC-type bacteriocin/lantibiotic exporter with double-glycine peptidase domain|nr:ABC transporter ATP-binding protein [Lachnospiraceae bacterium]